ncbi:hypothetical protein EPO05_02380 [Patescibacteria group bacterium]|nr:MAG: hypothetical protein EPO05_02380 [Patescibacteria group bacterium]
MEIIHESGFGEAPQSLGRHLKVLTVTGTDLAVMGAELENKYREWVETREVDSQGSVDLYFDMHPISAVVNSIVTEELSLVMTIFYNLEPRGSNPNAPKDVD